MDMFACRTRKQHKWRCLLAVASLFAMVTAASSARAQVGSARYSSIVVDAQSGNVLEAVNADAPRRPASLTKLMTLYLTFEALRDRRITLDQLVPVSAHAASMEPSKLGLIPGTHLTVREAILGLVTKSANDAASALGELLGGSEDRFAQMMTLRARALGMSHSTFENASGLPNDEQWTTAHDLALLARHIITDFPGFYSIFSTPSFTWHRQIIFNHDSMLRSYPGADGLKTGYTDASGHNLITSAVHSGVRLIGVVMGAATNGERDAHMTALLNQGFEEEDVPAERKPALPPRVTLVASANAAEVRRPAPMTRPMVQRVAAASMRPRALGRFSSKARAATLAERHEGQGDESFEPIRLHGKTVLRRKPVRVSTPRVSAPEPEACSSRKKGACGPVRRGARIIASR